MLRAFFDAIEYSPLCLVVVYNMSGTVISFNHACEQLTGFTSDKVVGVTLWKTPLCKRVIKGCKASYGNLGRVAFPRKIESRWLTSQGAEVVVEWVEHCVRDDDANEHYVVAIGFDVTEARAKESEALAREKRLLDFLDAIPGIAFIKDRARRITFLSAGFDRNFGYSRSMAIGRRDEDYLPRPVARRTKQIEKRVLESGEPFVSIEGDEAVSDGNRWMIHRFAIGDGSDRIIGGLSLDITSLKDADERFRASADASLDSVAILRPVRDHRGKVTGFLWDYVNANTEILFGRPSATLSNTRFESSLPAEQATNILSVLIRVVETGVGAQTTIVLDRPGEESIHLQVHTTRAGDYVSVKMRDISLQVRQALRIDQYVKELEELTRILESRHEKLQESNRELEVLASTDALTGLINRGKFEDLLDQHIAVAQTSGRQVSLVLLDFDDFKLFNDSFGHPAGDAALVAFSEKLTSATRSDEIVARYGGEEFAVLMLGTSAAGAITAS